MAKRKGECITLYCEQCHWSTDLPMGHAAESAVVSCAHCGQPIHWHRCPRCDLCYVGAPQPHCPICDDSSLDELGFEDASGDG